jgi:hypothetical protein
MDPEATDDQLNATVRLVVVSDPRITRFSPGSNLAMGRYFHYLYHCYGLLFLRKIVSSECTSKELLMFTLQIMSRAEMSFLKCFQLSDHVLCLLVQSGNFFTLALTYKTVLERKRLQAKRTLGLIVKGLWSLSPCSDTIFNICQFYALPFSYTELRVLINGFIGKKGGSIGYRRVVLRKGGKCVI